MQSKHLFLGYLNQQHPTPLLKLKVLSLFWSWRTAVQKILEFPRKKLLRLCFLTPALSVLDTWMCCQHSDLPERNILLTRKYGSKNCKANRKYLLNFSTPKEIGCSGLLLFSQNIKFLTFLTFTNSFHFQMKSCKKKFAIISHMCRTHASAHPYFEITSCFYASEKAENTHIPAKTTLVGKTSMINNLQKAS